jgi:hypothetical protein
MKTGFGRINRIAYADRFSKTLFSNDYWEISYDFIADEMIAIQTKTGESFYYTGDYQVYHYYPDDQMYYREVTVYDMPKYIREKVLHFWKMRRLLS